MTSTLPLAPWTQRDDLAQIVAALGAPNVRWVGGAVRDTLLGIEVKDVDAATPLRPPEVLERLEAAGIKCVPTGIEHGTITAVVAGGPVEVTTLRRDVATDGRRATVAFAGDWREDAARRDFTINALYAHPQTLEITDYFDGLADLAARRVRFIGDARQRIREDHLRILRYFRFRARFGAQADEAAEAACRELAETLKGLSRERIAMELLALLALTDPAETMARMERLGILGVVLPERDRRGVPALARLVAEERRQNVPADPIRRLAALLPAIASIAESVAVRLRLSKMQRARLVCAAERKPDDAAHPRALAWNEGTDEAVDRLLLTGYSIEPLRNWEPPVFPLKGGEIVERGVEPGPDVARVLHAVRVRWIAEGFPHRKRALHLLDEELATRA